MGEVDFEAGVHRATTKDTKYHEGKPRGERILTPKISFVILRVLGG